jgi:methionyl-tRNA formyltransferase
VTAARKLVLFGDTSGLPRLLRQLDPSLVTALVRAEVRPEQEPELTRLAAERKLPLLVQPRRTSDAFPAFVEAVRALAPDLILVDSYSMLLPPPLLEAAALGGVNVHGALLPRHRGANPIQWAILNDERSTGVTIHRMTEEIDAGAIVAQREVPIGFGDTWKAVYDRIAAATETLLAEQLPRLLAGTARATPQPAGEGLGNPRRTREDGRIDWSSSVLRIYNLVRALVAPLPGAFYEDGGREVVLDEFLTISQVAALKYGGSGRPDGAVLKPIGDADRNDVIEFSPGGRLRIDWDRRTGDVAPAGAEAIRRFAVAELGLDAGPAPR